MKTGLLAALMLCLALAASSAGESNWSGNYTEKKFLNGQAVFQLNILQEGDAISVDFDAAYNDGHGCAPEANGPAGHQSASMKASREKSSRESSCSRSTDY